MKYFFDTSVLVPVFVDEHPHHELGLSVFSRATKSQASCAVHSLAEVYATLTRLPSKHRASASEAMLFLENMKERLALIALDAEEYWRAMMQSAESGIVSGATYDALLAHCALKARAEAIITGNIDHFRRVGADVAKRARMPLDQDARSPGRKHPWLREHCSESLLTSGDARPLSVSVS